MSVLEKSFRVSTKGHSDVLDITPQVARIVAESGVQQGIVNIAGVGSTLGITTLEFEPGCVADLRRALDRSLPSMATTPITRAGAMATDMHTFAAH